MSAGGAIEQIIGAVLPLLDDEGECPGIWDVEWWEKARAAVDPHLPAKLSGRWEYHNALKAAFELRDGPEHVAAWVATALIDDDLTNVNRTAVDLADIEARIRWIPFAFEHDLDSLQKLPGILVCDLYAVCRSTAPPAKRQAA